MTKIKHNQLLFNTYFTNYKKNPNKADWDAMFFILLEVVENVAKSILKKQGGVFPEDFNDKVTDTVCNIMRLYILKRRRNIKFLGSFVRGYICNVFLGTTARKHDVYCYELQDNFTTQNENEKIIEIQGRYFPKKKLVDTIRLIVKPTQIKQICENKVTLSFKERRDDEPELLEQKSNNTRKRGSSKSCRKD